MTETEQPAQPDEQTAQRIREEAERKRAEEAKRQQEEKDRRNSNRWSLLVNVAAKDSHSCKVGKAGPSCYIVQNAVRVLGDVTQVAEELDITLSGVAQALNYAAEFQPRPSLPSVDSITMHVVQEFGVTLSAIRSARPASHARHVLCWLLREIRGETLSAIGGMVGGRSHGTVHAACKVVGDAVMANSALGKRAVRVRVLIESAGQMQEAS